MIRAYAVRCFLLLSCLATAPFAAPAGAQSIDAARTAYAEGRFADAARIAGRLGSSEGYALAARSLIVHARYVAGDDEKEALFEHAGSDSSTSTEDAGEASSPAASRSAKPSTLSAMPPSVPPSVKDGCRMAGSPTLSRAAGPPSREMTILERAQSMPILRMASRKSSRSSALRITSDTTPRSSMPRAARYPLSARESATLSATCPPWSAGSRRTRPDVG